LSLTQEAADISRSCTANQSCDIRQDISDRCVEDKPVNRLAESTGKDKGDEDECTPNQRKDGAYSLDEDDIVILLRSECSRHPYCQVGRDI
jgi:hypothetical protein